MKRLTLAAAAVAAVAPFALPEANAAANMIQRQRVAERICMSAVLQSAGHGGFDVTAGDVSFLPDSSQTADEGRLEMRIEIASPSLRGSGRCLVSLGNANMGFLRELELDFSTV